MFEVWDFGQCVRFGVDPENRIYLCLRQPPNCAAARKTPSIARSVVGPLGRQFIAAVAFFPS